MQVITISNFQETDKFAVGFTPFASSQPELEEETAATADEVRNYFTCRLSIPFLLVLYGSTCPSFISASAGKEDEESVRQFRELQRT